MYYMLPLYNYYTIDNVIFSASTDNNYVLKCSGTWSMCFYATRIFMLKSTAHLFSFEILLHKKQFRVYNLII